MKQENTHIAVRKKLHSKVRQFSEKSKINMMDLLDFAWDDFEETHSHMLEKIKEKNTDDEELKIKATGDITVLPKVTC